MKSSRETMLQRIRQAVQAGNPAGGRPPLPERGSLAYQGADPDPVARFCQEFRTAGGQVVVVPDLGTARLTLLERVRACAGKRLLLGRDRLVQQLALTEVFRLEGYTVSPFHELSPQNSRPVFFAADIGLTGVDYLIAETGSLVVLARPDQPRALSLLPPVHLVVAEAAQIVPDLFDLFEGTNGPAKGALPSCMTLITGPSKTGDIELNLVTGVHGPGEVHVVLIHSTAG